MPIDTKSWTLFVSDYVYMLRSVSKLTLPRFTLTMQIFEGC